MIDESKLADWEHVADRAEKGQWHELPEGERDFICAARRAVPELIAEVRRLKVELKGAIEERLIAAENWHKENQDNITLRATKVQLHKELDWLCHDNTALELRVKQLEKEADWLASKIGATTYCTRHKYCSKKVTIEDCQKCWREAARNEVNDASNNS